MLPRKAVVLGMQKMNCTKPRMNCLGKTCQLRLINSRFKRKSLLRKAFPVVDKVHFNEKSAVADGVMQAGLNDYGHIKRFQLDKNVPVAKTACNKLQRCGCNSASAVLSRDWNSVSSAVCFASLSHRTISLLLRPRNIHLL